MKQSKMIYKRSDGRYEARYRKGITADGRTVYASVYGHTREEAEAKRSEIIGEEAPVRPTNELNLLILGAGSHGHDVKEVAESLHVFGKISFLDDNVTTEEEPLVIGQCKDAASFLNDYCCAFVALGDNRRRKRFAEFLEGCGFKMPNLIAHGANVSPAAKLGKGIVIMSGATVGEAEIEDYALLEGNSFVGRDAVLKKFARLDVGAMVPKGYSVPEGTWLKNGEVFGKR